MIIVLCVFISAQYEYIYVRFFFGLVRSNYGTGFEARLADGVGGPVLQRLLLQPLKHWLGQTALAQAASDTIISIPSSFKMQYDHWWWFT